MANIRNGNTFYIDTVYGSASDELAIKNIKATYVVLTALSANCQLVLSDSVTGTKKLDLRLGTSGTTAYFRFDDNQIVFPNGIKPTTVTNAIATVVLDESRG